MREIEDWKKLVSELQSDNSKMAGQMGAMAGYLNSAGVPKIVKTHKRVQMLVLMYQHAQIEISRLKLLLNMDSDGFEALDGNDLNNENSGEM